jgi:hypothetical protein
MSPTFRRVAFLFTRYCIALFALSAGIAAAQNVIQVNRLEIQPLVYTDEHGTKGCGFRMLAMSSGDPTAFMEVADFSVNIFAAGGGMMKASLVSIPNPEAAKTPNKWVRKAPADFTIMSEDGQVMPKIIAKQPSSEDPAFLAVIGFDDAISLHKLVLDGQRMHLRVKAVGANHFRVLAFNPTIQDKADMDSARGCLSGLVARLNREKKSK